MTLPLWSTRRWTLPGGPRGGGRSRGVHVEVDAPGGPRGGGRSRKFQWGHAVMFVVVLG
jgi:hypothetical protein